MRAGEPDRRTAVGAVVVVVLLLALLAAWVATGDPGRAPGARDLPRGELPLRATPEPSAPPSPAASATRPGSGWDTQALAARAPLRCAGSRPLVHLLVETDLTGDRRQDVVVAVHCDAGAGSPPDGVYAYAGPPARSRLLSVLLEPSRQVLVGRLSVPGPGRVVVTGTGYSSPAVPRCCPDRTVLEEWAWTGTGLTRTG